MAYLRSVTHARLYVGNRLPLHKRIVLDYVLFVLYLENLQLVLVRWLLGQHS